MGRHSTIPWYGSGSIRVDIVVCGCAQPSVYGFLTVAQRPEEGEFITRHALRPVQFMSRILHRPSRPFLIVCLVGSMLAMCCPQWVSAQLGKPERLYYKSWAIVIVVENYHLAPHIPGAIEDAKAVAQTFRQLGFEEVIELD